MHTDLTFFVSTISYLFTIERKNQGYCTQDKFDRILDGGVILYVFRRMDQKKK